MDTKQFWKMIEHAKGHAQDLGHAYVQIAILRGLLEKLTLNEIVEFDYILNTLMARSYHYDLWAAAYLINGGCSDDGFEYFRGWLILQGEKVFEDALKDPESLAQVAEPDVENEDILGLAVESYQKRTGKELP